MFVKDYMTRHPIMIEPDKRVTEAQKLMSENKIRHLPVVGDGKRLIGMVTRARLQIPPDRLGSLNIWEITRLLSSLAVKDVMLKGADLHTISPNATIEEAAELMIQHKIGGLPVVEDGIVVGIITETDLLVELQNLLGAIEPGWRIVMRVPDRDGESVRLSSALVEKGWGIISLGCVRTPKQNDKWDIVLKVQGVSDKNNLMAVLNNIGDQEVIDVRKANVMR
ncbi:MAG TPA: CBS domain-containing protein [Anaerolineales bacterium]|nr:CBS domain-containing protein [Anaerolineales bacterium]